MSDDDENFEFEFSRVKSHHSQKGQFYLKKGERIAYVPISSVQCSKESLSIQIKLAFFSVVVLWLGVVFTTTMATLLLGIPD